MAKALALPALPIPQGVAPKKAVLANLTCKPLDWFLLSFLDLTCYITKFQKQLQLKSWGWVTPWLRSKALWMFSHLQLIWWDITWYFRVGVGEMLHLFGWVEYVECIGMPAWRWHGFVLDISIVAACFHYISVPSLSQKPSNQRWFFQSCKFPPSLSPNRTGWDLHGRHVSNSQAAGVFFLDVVGFLLVNFRYPPHWTLNIARCYTYRLRPQPSFGFLVSGMVRDGQEWWGMVEDGMVREWLCRINDQVWWVWFVGPPWVNLAEQLLLFDGVNHFVPDGFTSKVCQGRLCSSCFQSQFQAPTMIRAQP